MTNYILLFIGYTIEDWKFDLLLNWINSFMFSGRSSYLKIMIHPIANGQQQYIQKYFEKKKIDKVNIYWGSVRDFTEELHNRLKNFKNNHKSYSTTKGK